MESCPFPLVTGMPTNKAIDEDLARFEVDIRQLKIQYEQYFGGGRRRPPKDVEWRIEELTKRYGDRSAEMNFGQRFRYSNLVQTYVKYREILHKRAQRLEEGTVSRHFGSAARSIEAERNSKSKSWPSTVAICLDPVREPQKVEQLYNAFSEALEQSGESTKLSREKFQKFVEQKAADFHKQKSGNAIEFVVSVESGKARLKARVKR
jgi:hypothetical protein